ncbi:hypothetical protein D3C75_1160040 [compost metagenome]
MVGIQPLLATGDQGPQGMGPDQLVQRSGIGGGEVGWQIHNGSLSDNLASMQRPILAQSESAGDGTDIKKEGLSPLRFIRFGDQPRLASQASAAVRAASTSSRATPPLATRLARVASSSRFG